MSLPAPSAGRTAAAARRLAPGERLPLRVGFAGEAAASGLAAAVEAVAIGDRRAGAGDDVEALHALVVDRPARDGQAAALRRLCDRARGAGVPVVGVRRDGEEPAWAGLADLETGCPGSPARLTAAPAVDVSIYNPGPFDHESAAGYLACAGAGARLAELPRAAAMLEAAGRFDPVFVRAAHEPAKLGLPEGAVVSGDMELTPQELLDLAHRRLGVLDHPAFHASEFERAGWIAKLCAAGVPVAAAEISDSLAALLGEELAGLVAAVRARDLADLDVRERLSVALRRAALREHSAQARWRQICAAAGIELPGRPLVSAILSTRRQSWLEHGIAQVARQSYEPRELVVCLHGEEFDAGTEERVRALYPGPCQVIRVAGDLTLGDALNAGVEVARGELVTKMDDDDYYSTEHLWDLVLALEYSGADLVGKAAEFVYLEEIDVTVRQISQAADTRMAGGGMMARKAPLQAIGGWPQRSRGEDLALIRRFTGAGRPIHRIPPHGYILNRHGVDHTWRPQVDYFLFRSESQWRGLGFDVTAIEPPDDEHTRIPWT